VYYPTASTYVGEYGKTMQINMLLLSLKTGSQMTTEKTFKFGDKNALALARETTRKNMEARIAAG
jgi:hypothetical protein